jgi:hypothetical protein
VGFFLMSFSLPAGTLASFLESDAPADLILADAISECGVVLPDDPAGIEAVCGEIRAAAVAGWGGKSLPAVGKAPAAAVLHAHVCGAAVAAAQGWRSAAVLAVLSAAGVPVPARVSVS